MVFEETPAGLRLSVRDIKFKADSDEILPSEKIRLDEIAEVLKLAPNSQFLIEGHSAAVGNPGGEQKISELRAKKIAQELSARGIAAGKFICKGHGGNKPIAGNETAEGRAQNRRVEITILE
jgi:outer membrane protein OmpA-like peptidoglycan-associated protein